MHLITSYGGCDFLNRFKQRFILYRSIYSQWMVSIKQLYTKSYSFCFLCWWDGAVACSDAGGYLGGAGRADSADSEARSRSWMCHPHSTSDILKIDHSPAGRSRRKALHCKERGAVRGSVCGLSLVVYFPCDSALVKGRARSCTLIMFWYPWV